MRIGIIYAMEQEGLLLLQKLEKHQIEIKDNLEFHVGNINKNEIIIVKSGIGKVNAAIHVSYLNFLYHPDLIINTGIAGGSKNLVTKDVIIADKIYYNDVDAMIFGYQFGTVPGMPDFYETDKNYREQIKNILNNNHIPFKEEKIFSGDTFILSEEQIRNREGDFACDMEGASIAQTCFRLNVPFVLIRFVSDILDSPNHVEDYHQFETEMSQLSSKITSLVLEKIKA